MSLSTAITAGDKGNSRNPLSTRSQVEPNSTEGGQNKSNGMLMLMSTEQLSEISESKGGGLKFRRNSQPLYQRLEKEFQKHEGSLFEQRKAELQRLREFKQSVPLDEIQEHAVEYKAQKRDYLEEIKEKRKQEKLNNRDRQLEIKDLYRINLSENKSQSTKAGDLLLALPPSQPIA